MEERNDDIAQTAREAVEASRISDPTLEAYASSATLVWPPEGKPQPFTTSCATNSSLPDNAFPIRRRNSLLPASV